MVRPRCPMIQVPTTSFLPGHGGECHFGFTLRDPDSGERWQASTYIGDTVTTWLSP